VKKIFILRIICFVFIIVCCYILITNKINKLDDLPLSFITTFFCAIITAVINFVLKADQSKAKENEKKNIEIFKKKSKVFEEFKNRLNKVLHEQKINENTYMEIKSEFYSNIVHYLGRKSQRKITCYLMRMAKCVGIDLNERYIKDTYINKNIFLLRRNIFLIINVINEDLGLDGKIDIRKFNDMERKNFKEFSHQTLFEEIDNLFVKKDNTFFESASFVNYNDGPYVYINIKGENIPRGIIEIGPFLTNTKCNQEILKFRLLIPTNDPLIDLYTSNVNENNESKNENKYVNFFEEEYNDKYNQIKFQFNTFNIEWLKNNGFNDKDIYKKDIYQFGFDNKTYNLYGGFYRNLCKTIAAYAFCYFSTLKTDEENLSIKELCEKFGDVTNEEITDNIAEKQGIDLERE
jgi:hypothetical protein